MSGTRVFVVIGGRAWREMSCEYCGVDLESTDQRNQRRHPLPPGKKRWLWTNEEFRLRTSCPNAGKLFEFPCAVEVD